MSLSWSGGEETDRAPIDFSVDRWWSADDDPADLFINLTRKLCDHLEISRGILIVRDEFGARLVAVSTFEDGCIRKNLSLQVPESSSFFEHVAGDGRPFTDEYYGMFSGNSFEKRLLLGDDTRSYAILPLNHDGKIVGLLALSSAEPAAFATVEEGFLGNIADKLAAHINRQLNQPDGTSY
jgi:GAF domain-containing protein